MNTLTWKPLTHNNPFTAKAGEGLILMPETDRAVITLPAFPYPGDSIGFIDAGGTLATHSLTIDPNGNRINNTETDAYSFDTSGAVIHLLFTGTIYGWQILSPVQLLPFSVAPKVVISDFIQDNTAVSDKFLVWIFDQQTSGHRAELPPLSGNKGLYLIITNVSNVSFAIRPFSGDLLAGLSTDFPLAARSTIHLVASGETGELGWLITSLTSL